MMTKTKVRTGKLIVALALWAAALVSVAKAQMSENVNIKELAISSDKHAPSGALVSLTPATGQTSRETGGENRLGLRLVATGEEAIAGDLSATCTEETEANDDSATEPVLIADAGKGALERPVSGIVVFPPNCSSVTGQFPFFPLRFQNAQTGFFVTEFDATPNVSNQVPLDNEFIALSQSPAGVAPGTIIFDEMAVTIRFNNFGTIDARNGGFYPPSNIRYTPGVQYHFWVFVNPATGRYGVYVAAAGGQAQLLASDYTFRTMATSLDYWDLATQSYTLKVCNFKLE